MNIGLTGGIASGKSTVSRLLVERGALLVDADKIAREVVLPGSPVLEQIAMHFGSDMLLEDGSLNRKRLGELVFASETSRKQLESITHPAIRQEIQRQTRQYEQEHPERLVVVDIPLLYESGLAELFDSIVVVYVPRSVQLQRLMERDGWNEKEAEQRLNAQWSMEKKRDLADIVIDNSGSLQDTIMQVDRFWSEKGLL
ncbi:dephospho-CoA kinase [Paenibacillus alvei]|uniref:Dephospho-CoA kinase n=1 Tax=Paenibacillus alvei TaxID=44250 RepID=A0ABT4GZH8_PAEAL|nr:dephospho-CoA kinase [Paenibacillus alvei]EJW14556.1 dephospho-CoA kinase CoaE [Paenibacillus alvei DSM 29]MCY7486864.1 dephospho-CoA kinase [Paenibacillus alvei]MCY9542952.1 dephospho-CoA kinase [Paenibacillus alvei]MCY9706365.1 dephospho-CoA kinase [Paenibacillus alvei]MCY9737140.1 dephospho-CoA kinase [Paenibacillus alvei]